jgi:hypothetical protein
MSEAGKREHWKPRVMNECPDIPTVIEAREESGEWKSVAYQDPEMTKPIVYPCICAATLQIGNMLAGAGVKLMQAPRMPADDVNTAISHIASLRARELTPEEFASQAQSVIDQVMKKKASH